MNKLIVCCLTILCQATFISAETKTVKLRLIETSDVHGSFLPYDYINNRDLSGSMARVATFVKQSRAEYGKNVVLLDAGDILQGQPTCYYYNFIKTDVPNIASEAYNYLGYDAVTFGNHDIEAGHDVYDKWVKELNCPALAANMTDAQTGKPYTKPYTIIERNGVKIAVLGMITPAIPNWLGEALWSGLRFENMYESTRRWVKHIQETERPDILVGLFHCGWKGGISTPEYNENEGERIAREIPGFDFIFLGHDHSPRVEAIVAADSREVTCVNPGGNAYMVGVVDIELTYENGQIMSRSTNAYTKRITDIAIDEEYAKRFQPHNDAVKSYVNRQIGSIDKTITTHDCFFGSSAFTDLIHNLQLDITKADISLCAPLSFNAKISEGPITVSDMFKLYKYENQVCILRMTGKEVRNHLEMSYALWTNTMVSPDDHIMLLSDKESRDTRHFGFKNPTFNFDSAAGIIYDVDVTKPVGSKVDILCMSNGEPFVEGKMYKVAVNSYRANGGGELLTKGAGIAKEELPSRIIYQSKLDLRYYLMEEIERRGVISPAPNENWHFVPKKMVKKALKRDRQLIFGK